MNAETPRLLKTRRRALRRPPPLEQLAHSHLRLDRQTTEAGLHRVLVEEAAAILGARRVLVVLTPTSGSHRVAGARLPKGESEQALLQAVAPWLSEASTSGQRRLRHGP